MAFDDSHLAYWERSRRTILEHIEENPKVVVMYRDPAGGSRGGSTATPSCIETGRFGIR